MIDLHTHVLPGFDDGATDWQTAVDMCRMAVDDGFAGIVATPHFHRGIFPTPTIEQVDEAIATLREMCTKGRVEGLTIFAGADCHLHGQILQNLSDRKIPTLNYSRYFLLELPDGLIPPKMDELIFQLRVNGSTPIITHPERNSVLAKHPEVLYELLGAGAFAQVTASSLTGAFGTTVQDSAEKMLAHGLVQMMASDAHNLGSRPPILSSGSDAGAAIIGRELARLMVDDVPRAVLEDSPIVFPEPVRPRTKKNWVQKLARR